MTDFRWPADRIPGAVSRETGLTEAEQAQLAKLLRRPFALNKRERDKLVKLQRRQ